MAIEEREPANSEVNVPHIEDDESLFLSGEEDDETLDNNLPSTQSEKRREQKAIFESWLQTEAAQQPMRSHKQRAVEEAEDEQLSIKALMAKQGGAEIVKNPREYQLELFERAKEANTIAVLDTGSGKTLIAVLLIRWVIDQELEARARGMEHKITFFLVASVALMYQQHAVLEANLDHNIARFCGAMRVDMWTKDTWNKHFSENKVIVCTADVLLQSLSHGFVNMRQINLLIFDEAHHAKRDHPYARIIKDHYIPGATQHTRPRIFGMTASPADSKGDVYQSANELETVLHSQIATATDLSFQQVLKKSDERILRYGPNRSAFETELLSAMRARFSHVKVLQKAFDAAKDITAELGPWCADRYLVTALAERNLRKYESLVKREFGKTCAARHASDVDKEMAEVQRASKCVTELWNSRQGNGDDLSDKVRQLAMFLDSEFQRPSDYRCLVFVQQKNDARLLFELFKRRGHEHLRPGFLIGTGKQDLEELKSSCRQQVVTMTQFRKGDINCLFATSVAEEGLDVPDCNLVVRFSLYKTMVQYVQSRGRARQTNSRFIHMLEIGNQEEESLLKQVRYDELRMKAFCQDLPENRRILGNQDVLQVLMGKEKALKAYTLPSSEAKLTFSNALVILANFVSAVPTDSEEPQHPTYVVTGSGGNFTAEVLLPPGSPFRFKKGEPQRRRGLAKQSAAFEACHELLQKKYLDVHLLPTYAKRLPVMRNAHLAVSSKKTLAYDMMVKPLLWAQSRGKLPKELFATIVDFPDGLGRVCQPFAMLSRTPIPHLPTFAVFPNDEKASRVVTQPVDAALLVDEHVLTLITSFTLRVFKDIFSKTYEDNASQLSYWLAPVNENYLSGGCAPLAFLEWRLMQEVFEHEHYTWTKATPNDALLNRFFVDKWDGGRKFYSKSVSKTLKPLDPVPDGTAKAKWKANILDYSNGMYKKTREKFKDTWDLSQPVVEMETALARRNVLVAPTLKERNKPTQAFLCPQLLQISVLPPCVATSLFVWPSIIWRLESYLIALEAASVVGVQCDPGMALAAITKDSDNSGDHDAQERINFQHGMGENYERLEFLGDCFLKTATTLSTFVQLPGENEFKMHVARMVMLCNKNLFKVAMELKLYKYVRSRAFSRRLWYPEGLKLLEGKGAQQTEETEEEKRMGSMHNLAEKTIADVCEAMIGAAFLSHNRPGEWHPDQWENAVRTVTRLVENENHKMLTWADYRSAYHQPEYEVGITASQRDMAEKVEKEHNYHFQEPRLLRSAFIHPSQPFLYENLPNYQRLEFLGDALLDQASITYLFYKFPDKDPQWLTEHKMAMIGNRALGMIAATIGFHKHIRHCHATVEQQIRDYVTELQEAKQVAGPDVADYWTTVSDPPKCLADIVEAYVGAIFIDSGFDYSQVQRFFDTHIKPHFEDMSLYDGYANNHPCSHLHHLLDQTYGCQQYRIIAKQVPMLGGFDSKGVAVAVMIHNEVFTHDMGQSVRYARVRVAKKALEKLEGLGLADFRQRFQCECSKDAQADGAAKGVHADCGI